MSTIHVSVQESDFDVGAEIAALSNGRDDVGAVASFVGLVRADAKVSPGTTVPTIASMTLEHYPGMTERSLQAITEEALARWPLHGVRVIHRIGCLHPGERIVLVAVASAHRAAAFAACEFIMDYLKTRAPFWKKESTPEGERWVEARDGDDAAAHRWKG